MSDRQQPAQVYQQIATPDSAGGDTNTLAEAPAGGLSPVTFVALPAPTYGGRPTVFDAATKQQACALLAAGLSITQAASHLGCARRTLYLAIQRDPDFAQAVRSARH